jgi:hypothetical protein
MTCAHPAAQQDAGGEKTAMIATTAAVHPIGQHHQGDSE